MYKLTLTTALAIALSASFATSTPAMNGTYSSTNAGAAGYASRTTDTDADGITDALDNCIETANTDQRDTDNDGYGNLCDADLNNDFDVNSIDLGLLRNRFFSSDPDADFNGDGIVNAIDLGIFQTRFLQPIGPSGVGMLAPPVPTLDVVGANPAGGGFGSLDGTFSLVWTSSSGAATYEVIRELMPNDVVVGTTASTTFSFVDLAPGIYRYFVRACTANEVCSDNSNTVEIEVIDVITGLPNTF